MSFTPKTELLLRHSVRPNPCASTRKSQVSDRALRYRANQESCLPPGPRICGFCGLKQNVEVHLVDGHEEHVEADNLMWACRSCNTTIGQVMARNGLGRRTVQFNGRLYFSSAGERDQARRKLRGAGVKHLDQGRDYKHPREPYFVGKQSMEQEDLERILSNPSGGASPARCRCVTPWP